jgi:N4-gp56 family major capsid protein
VTITYNAPPGSASDIGPQAILLKYEKQALIDARQKQYLHELAPSAKSIPRNMGKTIVQDLYVPILDDRNTYAEGLAADGTTVIAGNLYGSSKDTAVITTRLPLVSENSARPNKVGVTRLQRTATITRLGMFLEWSDEAEQFDSDSMLVSHFSTELVNAACKVSEDLLMMHLLAGAQTIRYAGTATSRATITGEGGANASLVKYKDIQALSIMLDNAETPKSFKMYTGTNLTDTRTIGSSRPMFIGTELQPTVENMLDSNSQPAFVPVHKYAAGGAILNGEIGTLYHFRVVVHPDMQHWRDGANLTTNGVNNGYQFVDLGTDKYMVFPMLVVGDDSFATVGFQTTQNGTKFQIIINKPGAGMATLDNPYGNKGFSSIQWWYATLIQRPERLGLILTVAPVL